MCWQEGWEKVVLSSWQTRHVTCGGTQWAFELLRGEAFEIGALRAEQGDEPCPVACTLCPQSPTRKAYPPSRHPAQPTTPSRPDHCSKEKRSKHHKSSKVDRHEKGSRSKRRRRSRSASQ